MSDYDLEELLAKYSDSDDDSDEFDTTDTPDPVEPVTEEPSSAGISAVASVGGVSAGTTTTDEPEEEPDPEPVPLSETLKLDPTRLADVSLGSAGMLCELSIGQWGNRRSDRKAAGELAASKKAKEKMISVSKRLVSSPTLKAIGDVAIKARTSAHYPLTMPWGDNGWRYLPGLNFVQYHEQMTAMENEFNSLLGKFRGEYALLREEARIALGEMFDASVYPPVARVMTKFRFEYNYMPVPERNDFRVDIANEQKQMLLDSCERFYTQQITKAVADRWEIARDKVVWLIDRMNDSDDGKPKVFKESALLDAQSIIDLLDTFNITNDPALSKVASDLRSATKNLDAKSLRESESLRRATKQKLEEAIANLPSL